MSGLFYNLGRQFGRAALPTVRKAKWFYDGLAGDEEESFRAETALGNALAAELRATTQPANDPASAALAGELCHRLSGSVRDKRRAFQCEVICGDSPNAMALPGGFIFVSQPLIDLCERCPDELAFVIGHEMGHVIRRHAWDRMVNEAILRVASVATLRGGMLGGWLRQSGLGLLQSAHARGCELEADELGLRLATAARFTPGGAEALLRRVERLGTDPSLLGPYLASHPAATERIARLEPITRRLREAASVTSSD